MQSLIGPIRDDENNIILDDAVKADAKNDYFTATGPTFASKTNAAECFIDRTHLYKVSPTISRDPFNEDKLLKRLIVRSLKVRIVTELTKAPNFAQR